VQDTEAERLHKDGRIGGLPDLVNVPNSYTEGLIMQEAWDCSVSSNVVEEAFRRTVKQNNCKNE
jgi:hypothetical protein